MNDDSKILGQVYEILGSSEEQSLKALIEKKCDTLSISQRQFSSIVGIERKSLNRILDGEAQKVDIVSILKISEFLNEDVGQIISAYIHSLNPDSLSEIEKTKKATYIIENFELTTLKKVGFFESTVDFEAIENQIIEYFDLGSIFEYSSRLDYALFSRTKRPTRDKMRDFWVKSAYIHFEKIDNPNPFDRDALKAIITKIKPYSEFGNRGFITVVQALYNIGVTVIAQSNLPKVQIRGATFIVNNKPCIVLTDLIKNYGTIWFSLMHELYHVLYDLDKLTDSKFHLSEDQLDLHLTEESANNFAREMLFGEAQMKYIKPFIENQGIVSQYAKQNSVHSSIIYAFYAWDQTMEGDNGYFAKFSSRKLFPKADTTLNQIKLCPWSNENMSQQLEKIKNIFNRN